LAPKEPDNWRGIRLVNAYRVFLAFALVAASISGRGPQVFGQQDIYLFGFVAWGYLVLAMGFEFLLELHVLPFRVQAHLHAVGDLIVLMLVMHASGGPGGGIALLMIISVGLTAVLLGATAAMGYAALATLMVLGEAGYSSLVDHYERQFAAAGFLGFALFVVAILMATFEQRLQKIERLTQRRTREVNYLSTLAVQIIEQSSNGVLISEPAGRVDYINSAARSLLAVRRQEDLAPPLAGDESAALHLRLQDAHPALAGSLAAWYAQQSSAFTKELPSDSPLNSWPIEFEQPHRFRAEFHLLHTELGQRALVVLIDLTAEDARVQQNKLASLGRLTASIAHEVRNPLSSIRQAAELLADAHSDDERHTLIPIILRQSERINALVEGILDVARRPQVKPAPIDVAQWLQEFTELHRLDWAANRVTWQMQAVPAGCTLVFDVSHLWQIMDNLVGNAVRHGRSTDGEVRLHLGAKIQHSGWVELMVCDAGAGLTPQAHSTLFEPFFTTHADGVGLGLYISRELALANGAQLSADAPSLPGADEPGKDEQRVDMLGTCFRLRAPSNGSKALN
jgi:two-component system sensor histidine kinase PilS (NtrC family)